MAFLQRDVPNLGDIRKGKQATATADGANEELRGGDEGGGAPKSKRYAVADESVHSRMWYLAIFRDTTTFDVMHKYETARDYVWLWTTLLLRHALVVFEQARVSPLARVGLNRVADI